MQSDDKSILEAREKELYSKIILPGLNRFHMPEPI